MDIISFTCRQNLFKPVVFHESADEGVVLRTLVSGGDIYDATNPAYNKIAQRKVERKYVNYHTLGQKNWVRTNKDRKEVC